MVWIMSCRSPCRNLVPEWSTGADGRLPTGAGIEGGAACYGDVKKKKLLVPGLKNYKILAGFYKQNCNQ